MGQIPGYSPGGRRQIRDAAGHQSELTESRTQFCRFFLSSLGSPPARLGPWAGFSGQGFFMPSERVIFGLKACHSEGSKSVSETDVVCQEQSPGVWASSRRERPHFEDPAADEIPIIPCRVAAPSPWGSACPTWAWPSH